ncbi:hypothetical protein MLD38_012136 [Melastoma candidum]|uniref:Uncharacterized protein n=1 Tax=Melastoma candidum TaxID=119954 RepID=A0ACB9R5H6_9MYRT|nr:hypothetical protein MLD38_012136 [Melastoma candidum]
MGLSLIPMEQGSGLGSGNLSLSTWTYQIGLEGEQQELDKLSAANSSLWKNGQPAPRNKNLIWPRLQLTEGVGPLSLNLCSMGKGQAKLECEKGWRITSVSFTSFGTPKGSCSIFTQGSCDSDVLGMVKKECLGHEACSIPLTTDKLGDPRPRELKTLTIQALCST